MADRAASVGLAAADDSGYHISLVDGGPNFGVSLAVNVTASGLSASPHASAVGAS